MSDIVTTFRRWQFASDGSDIGFGVFMRSADDDDGGGQVQVLPSERYNAHLVPEDQSLLCPHAGVCTYTRTTKRRQ